MLNQQGQSTKSPPTVALQLITTMEQLQEVVASCVAAAAAPMPPEVVELEVLKRRKYLTTEEVEKVYPLKASALRRKRAEGEGPEYIKDGGRALYTHEAIQKYLDAGRQRTLNRL